VIPGVVHVVGFGKIPHPVDPEEVSHLQAVVNSGMLMKPCPFLKIGDRVLIEEGPLRNVEGVLIETKGSHQLVVSISLLQRSVAVCIERDWARPVK
jgi:transcription antitermination factor NusG